MDKHDKAIEALDKYLARAEMDIEQLQTRHPILKSHGHLAVIQRHVFRYLEGRRNANDVL